MQNHPNTQNQHNTYRKTCTTNRKKRFIWVHLKLKMENVRNK